MNKLDISRLDKIYTKYGYELKRKTNDVRVYVFKKNIYFGADIIPLNEASFDKVKKEFADAGFAVIVRNYKDLEDAENTLFDGFFNTEINIQRNKTKYQQFVNKQSQFLGQHINYQYIRSPFTSNSTHLGSNLIENIEEIISRDGAYLIIIEAAAGFGKTCTAYEILNEISTKSSSKCTFFAELSRSRENRTFQQVLLTEMDSEFPSMVKSDLVKHHIYNGRIPLMIDGFDELLSKEQWKENQTIKDFQHVETMLTTIGNLLIDNAKVILTSRKTAIFSGEDFNEWLENYNNKFKVIRFTIDSPEIRDWLDVEKLEILNGKKVPLKHISNPVLLAYLRSLTLEEFTNLIQSTDSILDRYFISMLEREQVRQNLLAEPSIQLSIFKKLARLFTEYNINAEAKDFIKDLIIDYNPNKLPNIRKNYPPPRPSVDELADTLTNHALLDRRDSNDNIGFINDFIFGVLIGNCLCEGSFRIPSKDFPQNVLELAVSAFKYYSEDKRKQLWKIIKENDYNTDSHFKLITDISLNDYISQGFSSETFESLMFEDIIFDNRSSIMMCVFINCKFIRCTFDLDIFEDTSFINCFFIDNTINKDSGKDYSHSVVTLGCEDYGSGFLDILHVSSPNNMHEELDLEKEFLNKLFKVDGKSTRVRQLSSLIKEFNVEYNQIVRIIYKLKSKNYIDQDGNWITITSEGINHFHKL